MKAAQDATRILIVDDEEDVTELVEHHLKARSFDVLALNDSNRVLSQARKFEPHLFVLDVMMPDLSGIQLCRLLRAEDTFRNTPIVLLTAKAEEPDRILGLETGADDYICKPFSPRELILRIEKLLKRSSGTPEKKEQLFTAGQLKVYPDRHRVTLRGRDIELTATEFRLLSLLIERKGRVQTRDHLLNNVWNYDADMETRTIDTHIRRVREKLGKDAHLIQTVRGVGYRVPEDV